MLYPLSYGGGSAIVPNAERRAGAPSEARAYPRLAAPGAPP